MQAADGKILLATSDGFFKEACFQSNGSLDTNFGNGGSAIAFNILGFAYALALQSDGKIGQQDKCSCRLNPTGTVDTTFGSGGRLTTNIAFPS